MSDCILATRWCSTGYGTKSSENHRQVWIRAHGPIPKGFDVDHICHNEDKTCPGGKTCIHRRCYNLEHLRLVTRAENLHAGRTYSPDAVAKRAVGQRRNTNASWAKPLSRFPARCIRCDRTFKGVRGLNHHYTKAHS